MDSPGKSEALKLFDEAFAEHQKVHTSETRARLIDA
jgi:hypothetical protein